MLCTAIYSSGLLSNEEVGSSDIRGVIIIV